MIQNNNTLTTSTITFRGRREALKYVFSTMKKIKKTLKLMPGRERNINIIGLAVRPSNLNSSRTSQHIKRGNKRTESVYREIIETRTNKNNNGVGL